jgi:GT2 family glycosyltransferase
MPEISVIIPHYQDLERLDLCLADLERQSIGRDQFEIIVSDNVSPAGEVAVRDLVNGRAQVVICQARGAGPARNAGVAAASGAILAFTDADCRPETDWLAEATKALATFDFVGGRMRVLSAGASRTPAEAFEAVFAFDNETYVKRKGFSVTANLLCRREVFAAVGGFRTEVSEDLDWSQRAVAAGFRIGYAERAVVGHPARKTWDELLQKWRRLSAETYQLEVSQGRGGIWALRALALPLSAVLHAPKVLFSPALATWRERWGALGVLFRLRAWRLLDALRAMTSKPGQNVRT